VYELPAGRGGQAVLYTCDAADCAQRAQIVKSDLQKIGIDVEIKQFPRVVLYSKVNTAEEPFDIADKGWLGDYPDPEAFLNLLLYRKPYFNDPVYNHRLEAAARSTGAARYRVYGQLALDLHETPCPFFPSGRSPSRTSSRRAWAARSSSRSMAWTSPPSVSGRDRRTSPSHPRAIARRVLLGLSRSTTTGAESKIKVCGEQPPAPSAASTTSRSASDLARRQAKLKRPLRRLRYAGVERLQGGRRGDDGLKAALDGARARTPANRHLLAKTWGSARKPFGAPRTPWPAAGPLGVPTELRKEGRRRLKGA
jgi:hypothetical protein